MKKTNVFLAVLLISSLPVHASLAGVDLGSDSGSIDKTSDVDSTPALTEDDARGAPSGGRAGPSAPSRPEPVAPSRPEPVAPSRPEPTAPSRPEPTAPSRPEPTAPSRPEPVAPSRPEPVAPSRPEPVAPSRPEPVAPRPPIHINNPTPIRGGQYPGPHWNHPPIERPVYNTWNWDQLRVVTCTAQDSIGYQFPVTESDFVGIEYQAELSNIEDAALDLCYQDSNGDASCFLVGCTPGY